MTASDAIARNSKQGVLRRYFVCGCCAGGFVATALRSAHAASDIILASAEPHHHVRFANDYLRVLEIVIDPDDATLFHAHTLDLVTVAVSGSDWRNEAPGNKITQGLRKTGTVGYGHYQGSHYVHRVANLGRNPFVLAGFEILVPQSGTFTAVRVQETDNPTPELENDRLRVWRLKLAAGEATPARLQAGPGVLIAMETAQLSVTDGGGPERTLQLRPAGFEWRPPGTTRKFRNAGESPIELVEFEIK